MHLQSSIIVPQPLQQVWALFEDPYFLPKWDRSVAEIVPTSGDDHHAAVGFTFDTVAPKKAWQKEGLRMSYRIIENIPGYQTKIRLERSPMFKDAVWTMRFEAAPQGTLITCLVDLKLRAHYFFMVPLLWLNKGALLTDLSILKGVIAEQYPN